MERFKKMKTLALFILALGFCLTSWSQAAVPKARAGVFIHNCEELQAMQNDLTEDYCLANDIDCSMTNPADPGWNPAGTWGDGKGFEPIGDISLGDYFSGSFDGQGYEIKDLYINRPSTDYIGLFRRLGGNEVKNVGLVNVKITGGVCVASLVSYVAPGKITNSYATGNVSGDSVVGGLVALNTNGAIISDSYFVGDVSGSGWYVGGLVSDNAHAESKILNSYSAGSVSGSSRVGGLVGSSGGLIYMSYSTSNVNNKDASAGGLVGDLGSDGHAIISNSYATGNVSGDFRLGGLVGEYWSGATISNSYATGNVNGKVWWFGEWLVGGLVGERILHSGDTVLPVVVNSYWDTQTSGQNNMCGGDWTGGDDCGDAYGRTTAQMKQEATFQPEWDFVGDPDPDDIWEITENVTYPQLRWPSPAPIIAGSCGADTTPPTLTTEAWIPDNGGTYIPDGGTVNLDDIDEAGEYLTLYSNASDPDPSSGLYNHKVKMQVGAGPVTTLIDCYDSDGDGYCDFMGDIRIVDLKSDSAGDIAQLQVGPFSNGDVVTYWSEATDAVLPVGNTGSNAAQSFTVVAIPKPPTCSISTPATAEVGIAFDIDVSGSTDPDGDINNAKVRFSSDNVKDDNQTGTWTKWFSWNADDSDGSWTWNAATKKASYTFTAVGDKEIWMEIEDEDGLTCQNNSDMDALAGNTPPTALFDAVVR